MRLESRRSRSAVITVVILMALLLSGTGCGLAATHTQRASDDWSNGKLVGTAILNNGVGLALGEAGEVFLVWVGVEHALTFARLNARAETTVERTLELPSRLAQKPQLVLDDGGRLHLIWLDRWDRNTQVFYARLSTAGEVIQEAMALSLPEQRVTHSEIVVDPVDGSVEVFWSDGVPSNAGCYHAALDASGGISVPAELLVSDGLFPVARLDRQGYVHLAWKAGLGDAPRFHYAVYDPETRTLGPDVVAGRPSMQMGMLGGPTAGAQFDGPWLGLDQGSAYLAWVLQIHERERRDFTFYVAFALPELPARGRSEALTYEPPQVTGDAVQVQPGDPTMTGQPEFLDGQPASQVMVCFTEIASPGNAEMLQIATVDVLPTQVERQEVVNLSRGASLRPNPAIDSMGHRHLAWIDTAGFERYHVVYASTSPQVKETLNRVTVYDVVNRALNTAMSMIASLFFTPLALIWVLVPVVWLVVFTSLTHAVEINDPQGGVALAGAMALQLMVKLLLFGDLLSRFPFAGLLAPSLSPLAGRWLFPVALALASAALVWIYLRSSRSRSVFGVYFLYAAIDSFLTLVVYVAVPMGW